MKVFTRTYTNEEGNLVRSDINNVAEEAFSVEEMSDIVDEQRMMEDFLSKKDLIDEYNRYKENL